MNLFICSVYDLATECYGRPFTVNHTAQALRSFIDECNNPESEISKHLKDYELWCLGTMSDTDGVLENHHERLGRAIDLKRTPE